MDNELRIFMQSVIKQCSNLFLSLHKYCEDYSEKQYTAMQATPQQKKQSKNIDLQATGANPKPKKKKKDIDVDKPKKPLTPFFIFYMKRRPEFKREYPNSNAKQMNELLGKEWRMLTEKDKTYYQDEFAKNFGNYKQEIIQYNKGKAEDPLAASASKKKVD